MKKLFTIIQCTFLLFLSACANTGEPVVNDEKSLAGQAYINIAKRIMGEEVPFLDIDTPTGIFDKIKKLIRSIA